MNRYRFKTTRMGFPAGRVIDDSTLDEGVIKTLLDFNAIEILPDEVDSKKNIKSAVSSSNSSGSKSSSKSVGNKSRRSNSKKDRSGD